VEENPRVEASSTETLAQRVNRHPQTARAQVADQNPLVDALLATDQPEQLVPPSAKETYVWSWIRVFEQIAINVLTVLILAVGGAGFALVYQRIFRYVVVPEHLLQAVLFAAVGSLITVVVIIALIAALIYRSLQKNPMPFFFAFLGLALGSAFLNWSKTQQNPMNHPSKPSKG
jgi:hypothetical protein